MCSHQPGVMGTHAEQTPSCDCSRGGWAACVGAGRGVGKGLDQPAAQRLQQPLDSCAQARLGPLGETMRAGRGGPGKC